MNHPHARLQAILIVVLLLATALTILPAPSAALRYAKNTNLKNTDASYRGETYDDRSANTVRSVGDLNGDGYDDFMIAAPLNDYNGSNAGQIYIIFGKAGGWSQDINLSTVDASVMGSTGNWLGDSCSFSGIGDINGDGFDDFAIGRSGDSSGGTVYLFFGHSSGWAMHTARGTANASIYGNFSNAHIGETVVGMGDVNGDGLDDFMFSGWNSSVYSSRYEAYLVLGSETGWKMRMGISTVAAATFLGEAKDDMLDIAMGPIGDINADGFDEVGLGSMWNDQGGTTAGKAYIFFGRAYGWQLGVNVSQADASFIGEAKDDYAGQNVIGVGDVNGDGMDDFMVSAYGNSQSMGSFSGKSYLYFGKTSGWKRNAYLRDAPASFRGENGGDEAGKSLAPAGDANGDGLNDILIGAEGNQSYAGRTYLLLGKTSGWAKNVSLKNADTSFVGESASDLSAATGTIAGGGDVNGDGLDDFEVGSHDNKEVGTRSGETYLVFPDLATKPSAITSVKLYSDKTFTTQISTAKMSQTVYVELIGTDTNASRADTAVVDIKGPGSSPPGIWLDLRETGLNTGKYRGNFTIKEFSDDAHRWIGVPDCKQLLVASIQDRTKNATLNLDITIMLKPVRDNTAGTEDKIYSNHYWTKYGTATSWTVTTNASWLKWNSTTHNISGTPDNGGVGSFWVCINVTDGAGHYDQHNFTLTIANIPCKILTSNIISATEDSAYSRDYNSDDDPSTTWSIKTNASWLAIGAATGILSGTPNNTAVGKPWVNVTCNDGHGGKAYSNYTLTVANVPPVFQTADVMGVNERAAYSVDYNTDDDPDVTYTLKTNASFLTIKADNGLLSGTPRNSDIGSFRVNITATDDHGGKAYRNFTLKVTNMAPAITNGDVLNATEDFEYKVDYNSTDDPSTTWSMKTDADFLKLNTSSGLLNGTPDNGDVGDHYVNITVNDGHGCTDNRNFTLSVANTPPTILTPDQKTATEDVLYSVDYNSSDDKDIGPAVTWAMSTNASWLSFDGPIAVLSGTPINKDVGNYWVNVSVSDGNGRTSHTNFTLTVINALPNIVTSNILTAVEDKEYFSHYGCDDDDGRGTIRWSLSTAASWLRMDPITGILNGTPDNSMVQKYDVTVSVDDGHGGTTSTKFQLNVIDTPPEITTIPATGVYERHDYSVNFNSTDDGQGIITWSMPQGPSWLTMDPTTGVLKGTAASGDVGDHKIQVKVNDGNGGEGSLNYTLTMLNIDDPPMWTKVPKDTVVNKGATYTFDVDAIMPDVGKNAKFSISSEPSSSMTIDASTGIITWVPSAYGRYDITISFGSSTNMIYYTYTIIVNTPPEVALVSPTNGALVSIVNPSFQWTATDADNDNMTADLYYGTDQGAVTSLSVQVKMAQGLKETYYIPAMALDKGKTYYWTVVPDDGHIKGTCASGIWSFKVALNATLNSPPKFTSGPNTNAHTGVQWTYEPQATDENPGDIVTITLISGPTGMTFESGVLKWTPDQIGQFKVKLEANDGKGGVFQEFTLIVTRPGTVNHAPVINQVKDIKVTEGQKVSVTVMATDADGDTVTFDILSGPPGATIGPNGDFVWQTKKGDAGEYDVVVRASDGLAKNSSMFHIKVVKAGSGGTAMAGILSIVAIVVVISAIVAFLFASKRRKASEAKPAGKQPAASPTKPEPEAAPQTEPVKASKHAEPEHKEEKPLAEPPKDESVKVVEAIDIDDLNDEK